MLCSPLASGGELKLKLGASKHWVVLCDAIVTWYLDGNNRACLGKGKVRYVCAKVGCV